MLTGPFGPGCQVAGIAIVTTYQSVVCNTLLEARYALAVHSRLSAIERAADEKPFEASGNLRGRGN